LPACALHALLTEAGKALASSLAARADRRMRQDAGEGERATPLVCSGGGHGMAQSAEFASGRVGAVQRTTRWLWWRRLGARGRPVGWRMTSAHSSARPPWLLLCTPCTSSLYGLNTEAPYSEEHHTDHPVGAGILSRAGPSDACKLTDTGNVVARPFK
jgi:hypothetical protein